MLGGGVAWEVLIRGGGDYHWSSLMGGFGRSAQ